MTMKTNSGWKHWMVSGGYAALLAGAIDPMEGSLLILPGSALVALGTYLDHDAWPQLKERLAAFVLVAIGVGALWGSTQVGGFGGTSGRSLWWGAPILLYLAGWSWATWARGTPRWVSWLGLLVGLWYLALPLLAMRAGRTQFIAALVVMAITGLVTIGGCACHLGQGSHRSGEAVTAPKA